MLAGVSLGSPVLNDVSGTTSRSSRAIRGKNMRRRASNSTWTTLKVTEGSTVGRRWLGWGGVRDDGRSWRRQDHGRWLGCLLLWLHDETVPCRWNGEVVISNVAFASSLSIKTHSGCLSRWNVLGAAYPGILLPGWAKSDRTHGVGVGRPGWRVLWDNIDDLLRARWNLVERNSVDFRGETKVAHGRAEHAIVHQFSRT